MEHYRAYGLILWIAVIVVSVWAYGTTLTIRRLKRDIDELKQQQHNLKLEQTQESDHRRDLFKFVVDLGHRMGYRLSVYPRKRTWVKNGKPEPIPTLNDEVRQ